MSLVPPGLQASTAQAGATWAPKAPKQAHCTDTSSYTHDTLKIVLNSSFSSISRLSICLPRGEPERSARGGETGATGRSYGLRARGGLNAANLSALRRRRSSKTEQPRARTETTSHAPCDTTTTPRPHNHPLMRARALRPPSRPPAARPATSTLHPPSHAMRNALTRLRACRHVKHTPPPTAHRPPAHHPLYQVPHDHHNTNTLLH